MEYVGDNQGNCVYGNRGYFRATSCDSYKDHGTAARKCPPFRNSFVPLVVTSILDDW